MQLLVVVVVTCTLLWTRDGRAEDGGQLLGAARDSTPGPHLQQEQVAPEAQSLIAAPHLSFAGLAASPFNFNYLSGPTTDLFGAAQTGFVVNQPLVSAELAALTQAAPTPFTGLVDTKYLEPAAQPLPFQFKSAPLVNSHIYHPRITTLQTPPRFNAYLNPVQFNPKVQELQTVGQTPPSKPPLIAPAAPRQLAYKSPRLLHRQPAQNLNTRAEQPEHQSRVEAQQNNAPRQQNGPPQRYYIRRKPQHITEQQPQTPPSPQQHHHHHHQQQQQQQLNYLQLQRQRLPNQPTAFNVLPPRQQNTYNTLPIPQNQIAHNLQANKQNIEGQQRNIVPVYQTKLNQQNLLGQQHNNNVPAALPAPPTPPRYYTNFKPMLLPKDIPVREPPVEKETLEKEPAEKPTEDEKPRHQNEKERQNEEQEENEEASNENQEESEEVEEEEPAKPKYRHRNKDEGDRDSYRREEDDEDDDEDFEENRDVSSYTSSPAEYSKLFSKYRYPKEYNFVPSYLKHHRANIDCDRKDDTSRFKGDDPDVRVKMYKYIKSINEPDVNESIEGKESESIPVLHHRKKSYKEHWLITKSSKSME